MNRGRATYSRLFEPGRIGRLELENRIIMAAMFVGWAEKDGRFSRRHIDYFAARAKGGVGLLVTESVLADTRIQPVPEQAPVTTCDSDRVIPRLKELAAAVHRHGARIAFQITPGEGRQSLLAGREAPPAAASAVPTFRYPDVLCRPLAGEEIEELVEACAAGSLRAAIAGFDMIDIHAHTGYLIDQFMTPLWNRRTDLYGGSLENRMRFPLAIVRAIKERLGARFPVSFRLTAEHRVEGGRSLDETRRMARLLEAAGVDLLTIDAGCYDVEYWMNPPVYLGEACLVDLAAAVREVVGIPVAAVGNILKPEMGERILEEGKADFVALGRSLLADPQWAAKARRGQEGRIRPCIMCNEYCLGQFETACMVNAAAGKERQSRLKAARRRKKVLVVGGGPAGMETARVAALRGHDVTLCERHQRLGGQLIPAADAFFKGSLEDLRQNLELEVREAGVAVELGCELTAEMVRARAPQAVVVATGAEPLLPPIPGLGGDNQCTVTELHGGGVEPGATIVVAGGGLNGCEAALDLAGKDGCHGRRVTVVEQESEVGRDLNHISRQALLRMLGRCGVEILIGSEIEAFDRQGVVVVDKSGERRTLEADTVVLALGARPVHGLVAELRGEVEELYAIGDCLSPRKIGEAIHEGYRIGLKL